MVCLSRPYSFKFFKGCFPQITWSILEYFVPFGPHWLKKGLFDRLKDQIVVATINGTPDVVTFLKTALRIPHNFKKDKVSCNALSS